MHDNILNKIIYYSLLTTHRPAHQKSKPRKPKVRRKKKPSSEDNNILYKIIYCACWTKQPPANKNSLRRKPTIPENKKHPHENQNSTTTKTSRKPKPRLHKNPHRELNKNNIKLFSKAYVIIYCIKLFILHN